MKFKMTAAQFNEAFEIVSLGDAGPEQFKKKEFEGVGKTSDNGKPVYRVPDVVLRDKSNDRVDKTASVATETPTALKTFGSYSAGGQGVITVSTYVNNGREAVSIIVPALTEKGGRSE